MIDRHKKIREIAAENPASLPVFDRLEIDYAARGDQTVEQACRSIGVTASELDLLISESSRGTRNDH